MQNVSVFPNERGTERIFSGVSGLKYSCISRVISLRGGHSHEMAGDYDIIKRAAHWGGSRAGERFCLPFSPCDETALSFFLSFFLPCQGQVASVVLIKGTVAFHASRFCTEYESSNGCCQSVNLHTKRQPGTRKISPDLQNVDKITKIQD